AWCTQTTPVPARPPDMSNPTAWPAWEDLQARADDLRGQRLQALFAADDKRVHRLSVEAAGLYLDCSKQRLDAAVLQALLALAEQQGLSEQREALFAGRVVNATEQRAAWHTALRAPVDGGSCAEVHAVLDAMRAFVTGVRSGD